MFNLFPISVPDLSGKTILVTGSGQGIGLELIEILVKRGAEVFAAVHAEPNEQNKKKLAGATIIYLDVTNSSNVEATVKTVKQKAGKLDILINNAGTISQIGHIADLDSDKLTQAYEVNVSGMHRVIVAALPMLKDSGGAIINAGTGAASTPMEGWTAYCCSKAGAHMLTRMFALELEGTGVQSFFIGIPPTDTEMQSKIRKSGLNPISQIPQTDLVKPDVPASVMAWLCSNEARSVDEVILDVRDERFKLMM